MEHGLALLQMGCERAQGYGIAPPMTAAALPTWVQSWRPHPAWVRSSGPGTPLRSTGG